jgi:EAL domain-containing protein (putative c-di-GMP-specific phosphodiesterase class I)
MAISLLAPSRTALPRLNAFRVEDLLPQPGEALRAIIDGDRLQPRYQPILDLRTGRVHGFEGLIRGPADSLLHLPQNLFKAAQLSGQVVRLEAACCRSLLRGFQESGQPHQLFLNVSPDSLAQEPFLALLQPDTMAGMGFSPERIVIEITENQPTTDFSQLLRSAGRFRRMGFTIAMDDLGEGYSSLRLWEELRPEYVKIDKHFVHGVARDPVKLQFLRSMRDLAAATGAQVVAEGIEREEDLAVILDLGLDLGQGFLFGHPAPEPHPLLPPGIQAPAGLWPVR